MAGFNQPPLFTNRLGLKIARASRGIPRLVNILCHKVLLQAYGEGHKRVTPRHIHLAIADTEDCKKHHANHYWAYSLLAISVFVIAVMRVWRQWL